ncbi:MAG TPA: PTS sugar transporter subunit IIA [Spirochaetota bacterium]|nr:PTS sugar transporter subunit IIA [Spirochaetota bacterium]
MSLLENLKKNNILVKPNAKNRWEIIEEMVELAVKNKDISHDDAETVKNALIEREKSMSTGIGNGVAIPHCSTSKVNSIITVMALTPKGLNFESIDNEPVKIVILLIVPKDKLTQHIKTLANIAKMMSDSELREKLLEQKTADSIIKTLKNYTLA